LYNLLPEWLYNKLSNSFVLEYLYEIRIRLNKPIVVNYKGKYEVLKEKEGYNVVDVLAGRDLINYIVSVATKQSLYAYNHQLKQGFITTDSGIRLGICGTVVYNNGEVSTIKNINSLNIRICHQVVNCSENIINFISVNGVVKNTLIISPPGAGKTTMIRDLALKLSNEKQIKNILVVDERFEIAGSGDNNFLEIGKFVDVISGSDKNYAFEQGVKTMNPKVIITDEISRGEDLDSIKQTIRSGVKVIATAHAENLNNLKLKKYFNQTVQDRYFERIVVLSKRLGVGTVEGVFDENLRGLFIPYLI